MLLLSGCGGRASSDPDSLIPQSTKGKDVTRAKAADNLFSLNYNEDFSLNPILATNHSNQLICDLVYENMIELDNNFEVIRGAGIISDWKCDDSGQNWELTIEPGHYFSDGTEVMPRDVSYSLGFSINSDRFRGRFASYQGASPGEGVVYVTLGIGDKQFIERIDQPCFSLFSTKTRTMFCRQRKMLIVSLEMVSLTMIS